MMRIYLVGFMGCGKTTLGKKTAEILNLNFIDLDRHIEKTYFKTIPQIFEEEGEQSFREKEHNVLQEISSFENIIVATGGGAPCFFNNMELMNKTGITIYISPDPATLASRLLRSKIERPLIKGKSLEELIDFINLSLKQRDPFYRQAKIVLTNQNDLSAEVLIEAMSKKGLIV